MVKALTKNRRLAAVQTPPLWPLDGAIQKLSRPEGVEVKFRLETFGRGQPVITTGRSVTAAKQKVYIEVETKQADRSALMKIICDGETFYRVESIAGKHSLLQYSLNDLQTALARLATTEAERVAKEDVEKEQQGRHGFEGVAAMVKDLRARMDFAAPQVTTATVNGKTIGVKIVEGQWSKDVLDILVPSRKSNDPKQPDPRELWNNAKPSSTSLAWHASISTRQQATCSASKWWGPRKTGA